MAKPFKRRTKKSPVTDSQRELVYRMESEAVGAKSCMRLDPPEVRKLLRTLCRNYAVRPVKIEYKPMGCAAEWSPPNIIRFSTWKGTARDLITVTHEFAHHLHDQLAPGALHQSHGPEFMACHLSVLDSVRYIPMYALKVICDKYGIKYMDFGSSAQSLRALKKALATPRLI